MTQRLPMCKLKKVIEAIAATSTYDEADAIEKSSSGMMSKISTQAKKASLEVADLLKLPDEEITKIIYGKPAIQRVQPNWEEVDGWMKLHRKVTVKMCWQKYCGIAGENAYSYQRFNELYKIHVENTQITAHSNVSHWGGKSVEGDYSGDPIIWKDYSGVEHVSQLYVGASSRTGTYFAYATPDQSQDSWLRSFRKTFEYLTRVPSLLVIDNAKALVLKPDRHHPIVQTPVVDLCNYYQITPSPCPIRAPKCKARVEYSVGSAQRDLIAAPLLEGGWVAEDEEDLNRQIQLKLDKLNGRGPTLEESTGKWKRFMLEEWPYMSELPKIPYERGEWHVATVDSRHCIRVNGNGNHRYSVAPEYVGKKTCVHVMKTKVAIYSRDTNELLAIHERCTSEYGEKTHVLKEHMTQREKYASISRQECEEMLVQNGATSEVVKSYFDKAYLDIRGGRRIALGALKASKEFQIAAIDYAMKKCVELEEVGTKWLRKLARDYEKSLTRAADQNKSNPDYHTPEHDNIRGNYE